MNLKYARNLPKVAMLAIIAVSAVVVIGAIAYVVGNASDAKFMFLVAVLAVGFGSGFGAFTLGFMLGFLQDSPSAQQKLGRMEDQLEGMKKANANLRRTLADLASGDTAPSRPLVAAAPPEPALRTSIATDTPAQEEPDRSHPEPARVVISLTPFLNSLKFWPPTSGRARPMPGSATATATEATLDYPEPIVGKAIEAQ